MESQFKEDFFWMLREQKGLEPWVKNDPHRLSKYFHRRSKRCFDCFDNNGLGLTRDIIDSEFLNNEFLDYFLKALIRADIRFVSRYVPQRSNEERLTGNLVSEIDNSINLIKEKVSDLSLRIYNEIKLIDFFYKDLSVGGKREKYSGADLGFILVVDLPDYPYTIKSIVLQVKKVNGSSQINSRQYQTLSGNNDRNCAYLFYDMSLRSLTSPIVLTLDDYYLKQHYEESQKLKNASFSISYQEVLHGYPLSIFLLLSLIDDIYGKVHNNLDSAIRYFDDLVGGKIFHDQEEQMFSGRLGIVSIGKKINYSIRNNELLTIEI